MDLILTSAIKLLERHVRTLVHASSGSREGVDDAVSALLSGENMRGMLSSVYVQSAGDLGLSHQVWNMWRDWEMSELEHSDDR